MPLRVTAGQGRENIVRLLVAAEGVDPNSSDTEGETPLHCAAICGHDHIIKILLEAEADPETLTERHEDAARFLLVLEGLI